MFLTLNILLESMIIIMHYFSQIIYSSAKLILQDYLLALCRHPGASILQQQTHINLTLPLIAGQLNDLGNTFSQFLHLSIG